MNSTRVGPPRNRPLRWRLRPSAAVSDDSTCESAQSAGSRREATDNYLEASHPWARPFQRQSRSHSKKLANATPLSG